ncbi:hypothetical protein C1645_833952 [Glomus cerebriforme]|uniref:Uncharacterized protein n=1 Tax=Glomus cerebriforme TaxID=658196 RepID=A0A397SAK9_9GLOM|nr:hypothetical protein C1645_833952 [Glomus cerebriforme]
MLNEPVFIPQYKLIPVQETFSSSSTSPLEVFTAQDSPTVYKVGIGIGMRIRKEKDWDGNKNRKGKGIGMVIRIGKGTSPLEVFTAQDFPTGSPPVNKGLTIPYCF